MSNSSLPTLDVVIPCYNEHAALPDCLDILLKQKDDIHRIILVDNNSSDDTSAIIERYRTKYPKLITSLLEKQQGTQFARNAGFDAATGEIIARIDADVHVQNGWARAIRDSYAANPAFMAASGVVDYYDLPFKSITGAFTWVFIFATNHLVTQQGTLYGSNMTIRTSSWRTVKDDVLMSDGIMEDTALSLALNRAGLYIGHIRGSKASASGRRLRSTPPFFWKYNSMWWRTYAKSGYPLKAAGIRVIVWFGNIFHALCWLILLFHDPVTLKWRLGHLLHGKDYDRTLP